ncbi:MAG: capsular biosynthesis protein [Robiginitomaculum sp.]|nr:MAG: capsular biosynthesis protein [Robiginitomaculum sp.]
MNFSPTRSNIHVDDVDDFIDVRALFLMFKRRLGLFFSVFLLVFSTFVIVTLQLTPLYTSTASVIIDPQEREVTDFESVITGQAPDSTLVDTEVEIIRSRALVGRIVAKLNLVDDPEFNENLVVAEGVAAIGVNVKSWLGSLAPHQVTTVPSFELTERIIGEKVVSALLSRLSVRRTGRTYIIEISIETEDPVKSSQIANAFADQYLVEQLEAKFESTSRSNAWLNDRLSALREEVSVSENAVEVYRAQSGLLSAKGSSLTEQQISELSSQLILQRAVFDGVNARLQSLQSQMERGAGAETIGEVLSSEVIRDLRKQQAEIAGRRAELSSRYGARHPEILKVERESTDINSQIQQEVRRIVLSLESEVGIARQKVTSIETGLSQLRRELMGNNQSLVRLRELERDAAATRTLFESFLGRFKETGQQDTLTQADARIISSAALPTKKSSPNTVLNIVLGAMLGGILGVGLVMLVELLDNGVTTGVQIEKVTGLPFIASVPEIKRTMFASLRKLTGLDVEPHDYLVQKPLSSFAESYRTLRSAILLSNVDQPPRVIAITSALPGDGKTVTTFSLGRLSAMSGSRTLIVDCDLRRRNLSKLLKNKPEQGLLQYLSGGLKLEDVIVKDSQTGCDILPLADTKYSPQDIFRSEAFRTFLNEARARYELIVLDTAPVLVVTETRTIANISDCVVLAVKWRRTEKDALVKAKNILVDSDANLIGVLLTQVNLQASRKYGYGDYGYYYGAYRNYYSD